MKSTSSRVVGNKKQMKGYELKALKSCWIMSKLRMTSDTQMIRSPLFSIFQITSNLRFSEINANKICTLSVKWSCYSLNYTQIYRQTSSLATRYSIQDKPTMLSSMYVLWNDEWANFFQVSISLWMCTNWKKKISLPLQMLVAFIHNTREIK